MTTVVYVINSLRRSGPVNVLYDIVANLDRSRYKPVIVTLIDVDPARSAADRFMALDVEIVEARFGYLTLELLTGKAAAIVDRLLDGRSVDIIHAHSYHAVLVASLMKTKAVRIATLHNVCKADFRNKKGIVQGTYMAWRYLRSLAKLDVAAAVSETVAEFYRDSGISMVEVIYNGVNTEGFKPLGRDNLDDKRRELGLPAGRKVLTSVGKLTDGKDPLAIIGAYKKLFPPGDPTAPLLVFLGNGDLLEKSKAVATRYDGIIFKGFVRNVADWLQISDYWVSASHAEGFALSILESLVTGVPVIHSDIGPFVELTELYGELDPLRFECGDVDGLARAIEYALAHTIPMEDIAVDVAERFSARRMAQNYMSLYDNHKLNRNPHDVVMTPKRM